MPSADRSEIYFIAGMMFLITIVSIVAVYFFIKTYKKEMRERDARLEEKARSKAASEAETK